MNRQEYIAKSVDACNDLVENLTKQLNETDNALQELLKRLGVEDDNV